MSSVSYLELGNPSLGLSAVVSHGDLEKSGKRRRRSSLVLDNNGMDTVHWTVQSVTEWDGRWRESTKSTEEQDIRLGSRDLLLCSLGVNGSNESLK